MKSVAIFSHALRQVFGNAAAVVRLTLFLSVVPLLLILGLGVQPYLDGSAQLPPAAWPWPQLILVGIVSMVASLWLAVGWHRFVLLDEPAPGITPRWDGSRILAYLWASIITILLMVLIGLVVGLAGGMVIGVVAAATASGAPSTGQVLLFILLGALFILAPIIAVFYRVASILPAAAVGRPLGVSEAWRATQGAFGAFYVLALMQVILSAVLEQIGGVFPTGSIGATVWFFLVQWVNLILGLSILTTIYGHYIERRELV